MSMSRIDRRELLIGLTAFGVLLVPGVSIAGEPLAVVVGSRSKVRDVSAGVLRRVFLGRSTPSADGVPFKPVNHRGETEPRVKFDRAVLDMDPDEVKRYWVDQKIRGVKPPPTVGAGAVSTVLEKVPGAICYLPVSQVGKLQVVSIDGKKPGASGYVLS